MDIIDPVIDPVGITLESNDDRVVMTPFESVPNILLDYRVCILFTLIEELDIFAPFIVLSVIKLLSIFVN